MICRHCGEHIRQDEWRIWRHDNGYQLCDPGSTDHEPDEPYDVAEPEPDRVRP